MKMGYHNKVSSPFNAAASFRVDAMFVVEWKQREGMYVARIGVVEDDRFIGKARMSSVNCRLA
jgi:hypothetical protein